MMIEITKHHNETRVTFIKTSPSSRQSTDYIRVTLKEDHDDFIAGERDTITEPATINIPATGDMQSQDIPEFLDAVRLAEMIACGRLVIE